jgi:uncharacterized protein involved in exopolysaccharide biosynthesis
MVRELMARIEPVIEQEEVVTEGSTDLAVIVRALIEGRKLIAVCTGAATLIAVFVLLWIPNSYTSTVVILPPENSQSPPNMILGQIGALAGLAGRDMGLKDPSDLYIAMLGSHSIQDAMISKFQLQSVYKKARLKDTRKKLAGNTEITQAREGLVSISVLDHDPNRSAEMANYYVEALRGLTRRLAISEASRRRLFYEQRIQEEKDQLAEAETMFKQTQESTGLIQLDAQGKAIIEAVSKARAGVAATEVQLATLRSLATDQNPDVIRLENQLAAMRSHLAKLEGGSGHNRGDVQVPTSRVPTVALEYARRMRDLKYHEAVYEFLAKQLEAARIDEARDTVLIQVVDPATPPETKSSPKRTLIVLITALSVFVVTVLSVLFREGWMRRHKALSRI